MSGYLYKLFNQEELTDTEKVEALREHLQYILDIFTDDEGNIYNTVYNAVLDEDMVAAKTVEELDRIVESELFSFDLMTCLLAFTRSAKRNWGATEATVAQSAGLVLVEVKFKDAEFKDHFYVEMDEDD